MPRMGVCDQIKKALQDIVAPELQAIRGDIRVLDQKIDNVDARLTVRIDALAAQMASRRAELLAEMRRIDSRIDSVDRRIDSVEHRIDGVDRQLGTALDVRERLAALEARRPA
jgi:chromosome segregation ATPase